MSPRIVYPVLRGRASACSAGEVLTMGREVWDMVSDFGSEECGVAPLLHRQTVGSILGPSGTSVGSPKILRPRAPGLADGQGRIGKQLLPSFVRRGKGGRRVLGSPVCCQAGRLAPPGRVESQRQKHFLPSLLPHPTSPYKGEASSFRQGCPEPQQIVGTHTKPGRGYLLCLEIRL